MKPMSKIMNNKLFRSKNCLFCFVCGIIKKSIYTTKGFFIVDDEKCKGCGLKRKKKE